MNQAVMLAGGRGTRLAPHTDNLPKPLVDVAGKPFLEHLLDCLARQGITELLILAGYRSSQVVEAIRDLDQPLKISVVEGDPDWSTGERLIRSADLLDEQFLLLYSDNLTVFRMARLLEIYESTGAKVVFSACLNPRGNVVRDVEGGPHVVSYLPDRSRESSAWVEVGFSLVQRDYLLQWLHRTAGSLPAALAKAADEGSVAADFLPYPYHSIGDTERLETTQQVLQPRKVLLVDRDGLINERPPQACYLDRIEDIRFIDSSVEALSVLGSEGFKFIIISNQAGIGRGVLAADAVKRVNEFIVAHLAEAGADVIGIYVCPHSWDADCTCRKPKPGMLTRAAREHDLYLPKTVFVGDDTRDVEAGHAAGTQTMLIQEQCDTEVIPTLGVFTNLRAALPALRAAYGVQLEGD
jgi:D-glycero-D-manno-heptose 1,7-bisphosphate phosphatase